MNNIIVLSVLLTVVIATNSETQTADGVEKKETGLYHHYDLAVLGTILAIKFKAVLLVLAVIFGIGVYFKLFAGFGNYYKGLKCPPPVIYDHKHRLDAYGYPDRHDRSVDSAVHYENMDFELLSNVMKGIGLGDLSFNITDKENGSCRRRLVCEAERIAIKRPVMSYTINLLRDTLSRYRTSRSTNLRAYTCSTLYPDCISNTQAHYNENQRLKKKNVRNHQ